MKEEKEVRNFEEDESVELNVEDLTDVQGGIEDGLGRSDCGLGCFIGAGYGPIINS